MNMTLRSVFDMLPASSVDVEWMLCGVGRQEAFNRTVGDLARPEVEVAGDLLELTVVAERSMPARLHDEMTSGAKSSVLSETLVGQIGIDTNLGQTAVVDAEVNHADKDARFSVARLLRDYYTYVRKKEPCHATDTAARCVCAAYAQVKAMMEVSLPPTSPLRLRTALSFAVFAYEVLGDKDEALNVARVAFEEALHELPSPSDATQAESVLLMQLLRDNLVLWPSC